MDNDNTKVISSHQNFLYFVDEDSSPLKELPILFFTC